MSTLNKVYNIKEADPHVKTKTFKHKEGPLILVTAPKSSVSG
jgi:hypothetical protein